MNLDALRAYQTETPEALQAFDGEVIVGDRGPVTFIALIANDDGVEVSLSRDGRKPSNATCNHFFDWLGHRPLVEDRRANHCRVFVMKHPHTKQAQH